ncbi:unnamed protein product [Amoebophrya sp. A120]|nr:unnamed protein product [Amoebophrya sp. A120]|eukprot:GSA120T00013768001.1
MQTPPRILPPQGGRMSPRGPQQQRSPRGPRVEADAGCFATAMWIRFAALVIGVFYLIMAISVFTNYQTHKADIDADQMYNPGGKDAQKQAMLGVAPFEQAAGAEKKQEQQEGEQQENAEEAAAETGSEEEEVEGEVETAPGEDGLQEENIAAEGEEAKLGEEVVDETGAGAAGASTTPEEQAAAAEAADAAAADAATTAATLSPAEEAAAAAAAQDAAAAEDTRAAAQELLGANPAASSPAGAAASFLEDDEQVGDEQAVVEEETTTPAGEDNEVEEVEPPVHIETKDHQEQDYATVIEYTDAKGAKLMQKTFFFPPGYFPTREAAKDFLQGKMDEISGGDSGHKVVKLDTVLLYRRVWNNIEEGKDGKPATKVKEYRDRVSQMERMITLFARDLVLAVLWLVLACSTRKPVVTLIALTLVFGVATMVLMYIGLCTDQVGPYRFDPSESAGLNKTEAGATDTTHPKTDADFLMCAKHLFDATEELNLEIQKALAAEGKKEEKTTDQEPGKAAAEQEAASNEGADAAGQGSAGVEPAAAAGDGLSEEQAGTVAVGDGTPAGAGAGEGAAAGDEQAAGDAAAGDVAAGGDGITPAEEAATVTEAGGAGDGLTAQQPAVQQQPAGPQPAASFVSKKEHIFTVNQQKLVMATRLGNEASKIELHQADRRKKTGVVLRQSVGENKNSFLGVDVSQKKKKQPPSSAVENVGDLLTDTETGVADAGGEKLADIAPQTVDGSAQPSEGEEELSEAEKAAILAASAGGAAGASSGSGLSEAEKAAILAASGEQDGVQESTDGLSEAEKAALGAAQQDQQAGVLADGATPTSPGGDPTELKIGDEVTDAVYDGDLPQVTVDGESASKVTAFAHHERDLISNIVTEFRTSTYAHPDLGDTSDDEQISTFRFFVSLLFVLFSLVAVSAGLFVYDKEEEWEALPCCAEYYYELDTTNPNNVQIIKIPAKEYEARGTTRSPTSPGAGTQAGASSSSQRQPTSNRQPTNPQVVMGEPVPVAQPGAGYERAMAVQHFEPAPVSGRSKKSKRQVVDDQVEIIG